MICSVQIFSFAVDVSIGIGIDVVFVTPKTVSLFSL